MASNKKEHDCSCSTSDMLMQVRIAMGVIEAPETEPAPEAIQETAGRVEIDFDAARQIPEIPNS